MPFSAVYIFFMISEYSSQLSHELCHFIVYSKTFDTKALMPCKHVDVMSLWISIQYVDVKVVC